MIGCQTLNPFLWLLWIVAWLLAARSTTGLLRTEFTRRTLGYRMLLAICLFLVLDPLGGRWRLFSQSPRISLLGTCLTIIGLLFSLCARGHLGSAWSGDVEPREPGHLVRTGPYAWMRHPIYAGFLLAAGGSALTNGSALAGMGFLTLVGICGMRARNEDAALRAKFGG